ncbi:MAG: hydrogenase expression/formation protein HypE [Caldithrix sp. RBG_13_44_9]|nr:MAG: hydrogenase expression/formation protein HypE [Caldithrix sp. RBG_13_44_9]
MSEYERILLAHGGGGTLSHQLLQKMFFPQFDNELLRTEHDGAVWEMNGVKLAFSTDSYVVKPIFFPGGDIGELAVYGTVNDLAVCGAQPLYLSAGFIIEEGCLMEDLWRIIQSMKKAAEQSGVKIVTGDTKVVDRGKGDKIYINTSGVGVVYKGVEISSRRIQSGDKIILNGKIAEHGIAILSAREEFDFKTSVKSDTAPLNGLIKEVLQVCPDIHMMRDPTRGGISSAMNEIAAKAQKGIRLDEKQIPIDQEIKAICEILGLDPLYIANEGKVLLFVPPTEVSKVLQIMHRHPYGKEAVVIGEVVDEHPGRVVMKTLIGSNRVVDMISGEQLPRIC